MQGLTIHQDHLHNFTWKITTISSLLAINIFFIIDKETRNTKTNILHKNYNLLYDLLKKNKRDS